MRLNNALNNLIFYSRIPKTRFFTTLYPKQISLSPGTTFNLPITFRPLEKNIYNDEITFHFHDFQHDFAVSMLGSLPVFKLEVVKLLDFGMCNAFENVEQEVELKNLRLNLDEILFLIFKPQLLIS
jgi:cilia- and flagella-associated protein 65